MDLLVAVQGLLVAEVLPAHGALVGRLPGVHAPVFQQVIPPDEALPALRTLVGPLARVDALVPDGFGQVPEVLAAVGAGQRPVPLPRMQLLVEDEAHLQAEALLALRARVGSLHHVVGLVPDEAVLDVAAPLGLGALGWLGTDGRLGSRGRCFGLLPEALPGLQQGAGAAQPVDLLVRGEELLV